MIRKFIYRLIFPVLLSRACESRIPRSGHDGARVNCFVVSLDNNGEPFFFVTEYKDSVLYGLKWDGNAYTNEHSLALEDIGAYELRITHYYGLATIIYNSILNFAFHYVTRLQYLKIGIAEYLEAAYQYFFNKRKLITKKRMELLEFMMNDQLDREHKGINITALMTKLYSINWVLHPSADEQEQKLELFLESLVQSGELHEIEHEYVVTGKAISTLERYEEEERRHSEAVRLQIKMIILTVLLVVIAIIQAGLIKLPVLLDLSSLSADSCLYSQHIQTNQNQCA